MKNFKAVKPNLAESYNRLFGSTHRNLLTEAYARDTKDGKTLDKYFDELVPSSGPAGTVNGEIVREATELVRIDKGDPDKEVRVTDHGGYVTIMQKDFDGRVIRVLIDTNQIPQLIAALKKAK
jgi:hypothetical protein